MDGWIEVEGQAEGAPNLVLHFTHCANAATRGLILPFPLIFLLVR